MISKFKQWWAGLCLSAPYVSADQLPPVTVTVPRTKPPRNCRNCGGEVQVETDNLYVVCGPCTCRLFRMTEYPHWNSPDVLPPVGCPIVLRIGCAVVQAERTAHIERRDREMTYKLPTGQELVGRYEWSYP